MDYYPKTHKERTAVYEEVKAKLEGMLSKHTVLTLDDADIFKALRMVRWNHTLIFEGVEQFQRRANYGFESVEHARAYLFAAIVRSNRRALQKIHNELEAQIAERAHEAAA
jgi:hypothetical protein